MYLNIFFKIKLMVKLAVQHLDVEDVVFVKHVNYQTVENAMPAGIW